MTAAAVAATKLTVPTVHLNGTSAANLYEQVLTAGEAVREALDALHGGAPHGRDYYPQGAVAFYAARAEHVSRLARLESVLSELTDIANAIVKHI
jgi:hypothetical protein